MRLRWCWSHSQKVRKSRGRGHETKVEFVTERKKLRDGGNETKVELVTLT